MLYGDRGILDRLTAKGGVGIDRDPEYFDGDDENAGDKEEACCDEDK